MPYICLARGDIPDSSVQVLDLFPNASQALPTGPRPQARYVNRAKSANPHIQSNGTLGEAHVDGLAAYLLDRVEPGGLQVASGTLTMTGPLHGDTVTVAGVPFTAVANFAIGSAEVLGTCAALDTITINGVVFTAKHAAPLGATQFLDAQAPNTPVTSATSLVAQIMATPALAAILTAANAGGTVATVTLTAADRGLVGQYSLAEGSGHITLSGANMVAAVPVAASQEFAALAQAVGGTNAAVATSFRTSLVNAASIIAMKAAAGGLYATAAAPGAAIVTITAVDNAGAALAGPTGNLEFNTSTDVRLVRDATSIVTDVLNRTNQMWSLAKLTATTAAVLARLDAGSALALSDLNTILLAQVGAELTAAGGSNSTGVVSEILAILAGRGYRIRQTDEITGASHYYMTQANPLTVWNPTQLGGFTELHREFSANWGHGEVRPNTIGGDWVAREVSPITHTVDTDAFKISLASGQLAVFGKVTGMPPVTLWPDSDILPHYPWTFQGSLQFPAVANARVLTVYDDNGNVLA